VSEVLYPYYERELAVLRQLAQEFARRYPATAGRLLLEPGRSGDPHVERLIQSFALLTARVQNKLDDEFPELTQAMLNVLYPHYLAPVPSLAILELVADPTRLASLTGFPIAAGSRVRAQRLGNHACRYRTGYPVHLWPITVSGARLAPPPYPPGCRPPGRSAAALFLQLECQGEPIFERLELERLRFFLAGDGPVTAGLYELLFNHVLAIEVRSLDEPQLPSVRLDPTRCLHPVGFERDEGLLQYPRQSFVGYRLLTEFFAFHHKFLFFDLAQLDLVCRAGFRRKIEVVFYLNRTQANLEQAVDALTFRLGCTPIVNLFEQTAEPIALTQAKHEYRITPEVSAQDVMEVYSVNAVLSTDPMNGVTKHFQPFFSLRHARGTEPETFWYASRKQSVREGDHGTDVYLHLVDLNFQPRLPAESTLVVWTTCTNRALPRGLQQFGERVQFELEEAAPLASVRCPRTPTSPLPPPLREGAYWRLLSHLNLNHLSICDAEEGKAALQEILQLYDFTPNDEGPQRSAARNLIDGVRAVRSRRTAGRVAGGPGGYARGVEITLDLDEAKYVGTGAYLFASVLERFFALYASINSFTQLIARGTGSEGLQKKWPPRVGDRPLI
jgi:type VI secretion system protein ImpG